MIQVCAGLEDASALARELRALEDAKTAHRAAKARLITLTFDQIPAGLPKRVTALPAWQWLLA